MSYCYDMMSKAWARIEAQLPEEARNSEEVARFGLLIEEMHEANHRLRDAINHDHRVSACARKLDAAMQSPAPEKRMLINLTSNGHDPDIFVTVTESELAELRRIEKTHLRLTSPKLSDEERAFVASIVGRAQRASPFHSIITYYE